VVHLLATPFFPAGPMFPFSTGAPTLPLEVAVVMKIISILKRNAKTLVYVQITNKSGN